MENKEKKCISIKQWFSDIISLRKTIFNYNKVNLLSILIIVLSCFTLVQLATAGFLKCMVLFVGWVSGKNYLAANNIIEYFMSPLVMGIGAIYIIVLCNILMFQIGIFVYVYEESKNNRKASLKKMLDFGFYSVKKLFNPRNWFIYLFVLLILPLADVFKFSYFNVSLVVPGFVLDVINSKLYFAIPYYIVMGALSILAIFSSFSFHYFLLEDISFYQACKKSIKLFKKKINTNIIVSIIEYVSIFLVYLIVSIIIVLFISLFRSNGFDVKTLSPYVWDFILTFMLISSLPMVFSTISVLFHNSGEEEVIKVDEDIIAPARKLCIIRNVILGFVILLFTIIDIGLNVDNYSVYNNESSKPIVIAHRGSSFEAPENSIPAFELAIEQGADVIELDIHQTKDGVLVITHDDSLNRIAKINKHVYDLTYEEISKLDVGSWFSEKYSYLRVATLEDVLTLTKDKINLIIEIKPTDYDNHLEEELIRLINKYDMKNQIVVHSLKDEPLMRIKELDSSITVAYCMFLALGDIDTIEWSDLYTVEESNITPELVRKVHDKGKKIYVWTINKADNIQYLIDCGVDGFIGDDINLLKEQIDASIYDKGFSKFFRMLSLQQWVM